MLAIWLGGWALLQHSLSHSNMPTHACCCICMGCQPTQRNCFCAETPALHSQPLAVSEGCGLLGHLQEVSSECPVLTVSCCQPPSHPCHVTWSGARYAVDSPDTRSRYNSLPQEVSVTTLNPALPTQPSGRQAVCALWLRLTSTPLHPSKHMTTTLEGMPSGDAASKQHPQQHMRGVPTTMPLLLLAAAGGRACMWSC
jgi:hypothetical protein